MVKYRKNYGCISFLYLKKYLEKKGWIEEPYSDHILKFKAIIPSGADVVNVLIPAKFRIPDFDLIIELSIEVIARFEQRTPEDVIRDIIELQEAAEKTARKNKQKVEQ